MMSVERIAHFVRPRTFMMDLLLLRVSKLCTQLSFALYVSTLTFYLLHGESEFQKKKIALHFSFFFLTKMKKYQNYHM